MQGYGGSSDEVWDRFLSDLESLPDDFAVLGVNDYLFIDGYRRLREAKLGGRLQNIETLLPVIEFRLSKFAGHDKMLRLNYHLIFSEGLDPDVIESQFLLQLRAGLNVSADNASVAKQWNAAVTRASLADLGRLIREDMPPERADEIDESDFLLGFNNLNFDETRLLGLLENSYLRGRYVAAIGKTEWDQYRWNDHSIAGKKDVINSVQAVFTAAGDMAAFERSLARLRTERVNDRLFDCSDAHAFSDSADKDRLGNCLTWVKADTTLDGLILAIKDYPERVFVGPRPPVLADIDKHPGKYIRRVALESRSGRSPADKWFEGVEITLNPELVAVIGNRGMGKSALLDSIALGGNSSRPSSELSFLKPFQATRGGLADSFVVSLKWYAPEPDHPVPLSSSYDPSAPSRVKHLPQHFIDSICNEEHGQFEEEIERVVFSHVREEERLGLHSLSELVDFRMQGMRQAASDIKTEISALNEKIAALESDLSPTKVANLESLLAQRRGELGGIWARRPALPPTPDSSDPELDASINTLRRTLDEQRTAKATAEQRLLEVRAGVEAARRVLALIEKLERDIARLAAEHADDLRRIGLAFEQVITVSVKRDDVVKRELELVTELSTLRASLDETNADGLAGKLAKTSAELKEAEDRLSAPLQVYQSAKHARREFRETLRSVIGSEESRDSIRNLMYRLSYLNDEAAQELHELEGARLDKAEQLFEAKSGYMKLLRELYAPVQEFVDAHPPTDEAFRVAFSASLEASGFASGFLSHVANNKKGSFHGTEQALGRLKDLEGGTDFNDWDSVKDFLARVSESLRVDMRPGEGGARRQVGDQTRPGSTVAELYDFLFHIDYVRYRHHLTMGGRPLGKLSPGEKGALLLVFYLLVDRSDCPLLVDQPEENLDNQSVFRVLVPFIKEARRRRQVILVTHNPNIAVVAGAEQVIYCEMDKQDGYRLSYMTGALENPVMNQHVVDVLEGTRPAFSSRDETYQVSANPKRG